MFEQMAEAALEHAIAFAELLLELLWAAAVALFHVLMLVGQIALDFFRLLLTTLQNTLLQL